MKLYYRENYLKKIRGFYHTDDIIKVITGVRRCGKSSLMEMIASEIKESGVPKENIIFINLDKRGFKGIKTTDALEKLIDEKSASKGMKYLFIDEVQNVDGFEEVMNAYRTEGGYSIFITGSNSYLLSGELMTKLTGRYLEFEMYPLSFEEYENMKAFYKIAVNPNPAVELSDYIIEGGFPRAVLLPDLNDKRKYVHGVVEEIIEKDIRRRIKIRNKDAFETVMNYIINNFGATMSINNICGALKANGNSISKATVSRYIQALVDAKMLCECKRFDMKSRKSLSGEQKYYLSDLSFYFARNTDNTINYGPVLENIIYIYARSKDYSVSVGKIGNLECDFILRSPDMNYSYVQVAFTIMQNKETEDREYRALEKIKDNYPKYVTTTDYIIQKRNGINHVNLIDFIKKGNLF